MREEPTTIKLSNYFMGCMLQLTHINLFSSRCRVQHYKGDILTSLSIINLWQSDENMRQVQHGMFLFQLFHTQAYKLVVFVNCEHVSDSNCSNSNLTRDVINTFFEDFATQPGVITINFHKKNQQMFQKVSN